MIEVSVYVSAKDFAENNCKYCERFNYHDIVVPYDSIINSFRCIYGQGCIVTFTIML